jgi:hypothetical protein
VPAVIYAVVTMIAVHTVRGRAGMFVLPFMVVFHIRHFFDLMVFGMVMIDVAPVHRMIHCLFMNWLVFGVIAMMLVMSMLVVVTMFLVFGILISHISSLLFPLDLL